LRENKDYYVTGTDIERPAGNPNGRFYPDESMGEGKSTVSGYRVCKSKKMQPEVKSLLHL
jgi:hypothetical protein